MRRWIFWSEFSARCCSPEGNNLNILKIIATYANVFMVRGICSWLCATFGHHASTGFTADQLFPLVWKAARILECVGFKAWVCDGASTNRKFFKINHLEQEAGIVCSTINRFEPSQKIYLISDVPHLLKTTRNNLENSHGNLNARNYL